MPVDAGGFRASSASRMMRGMDRDLPRVADKLYHSARVFRVFTLERREIDEKSVVDLLRCEPAVLEGRIQSESPLL